MPNEKLAPNASEPSVIATESNARSKSVIRGSSIKENPNRGLLEQAKQAAQRASESEREKNLAEQQADIVNESSLRTAMQRRRIFYSKILSVEEYQIDGQTEVVVAILLGKNIKVIIPFSEMFPRNPMNSSRVDPSSETPVRLVQRKRQLAERMMGADTPFILTGMEVNGDMIIATGSRAQAMNMIAERAFGGSNPRYKVGDLVEARIISVSVHALTVMFEGVDVTIPMAMLTRRWILDLHDAYNVGEPIYARIRGIMKENDVYRVQLDTISVELEDALDRYHVLSDGARTRAIITAVFKTQPRAGGADGQNRIFAWIPHYELPVRVVRLDSNTFGRKIPAGTEVIVRVNRHSEDGYLICEAIYDYGNNSMFSQGRYR